MKTLFAIVVLAAGCVGEAPSIRPADADAEVTIEEVEVEVEAEAEVIEEVEVEVIEEVGVEVIEEVEAEAEAEVIEEVEAEAEVIEEVEVEAEAEVIEEVEVEVEVEAEVIEDTVLVDTNPVAEATPEVSPETELVEDVETLAEVAADVGETEVGPACPGECVAWTTTCSGSGGYKLCVPDPETGCGEPSAFIGCQDGNTCSNGECIGTCAEPEIVFVVDRSSSMMGAKWDMTRAELLAFVDRYGPGTRIGLRTFPATDCAAGEVVPLGTDNSVAVEAGLTAPGNASSSPLAAALTGLGAHFGEANQGERVVLVSDGSESCADVEATLAAAVELRSRGAVVDTIGIGSNYDVDLLAAIATAGGGSHRSATNGAALNAALADIAVVATGCGPTDEGGYCKDGACFEGCDEGAHACDDECVSNDDVATCGDRCSPCPTSSHGASSCLDETCSLACGVGYTLCDGGSACCRWNTTTRGVGTPFGLTVLDSGDVRYFQDSYRRPNATEGQVAFVERKSGQWFFETFVPNDDVFDVAGALSTDGGARLMYMRASGELFAESLDDSGWTNAEIPVTNDATFIEGAVALGSDGTAHSVTREFSQTSEWLGYRSARPGAAWGPSEMLALRSGRMGQQRVVLGPAGQVCLVWLDKDVFEVELLELACRVDGVWNTLTGPTLVNWATIQDAAFDRAGNLHVLRMDRNQLVTDQVRSPAGVWTTSFVAVPPVAQAVLATDRRGELRLLLSQRDVTIDHLFRWNGSAWAEGKRLDMEAKATAFIAFDRDNDPAVLYRSDAGGELKLLELVP